MKFQLPSNLTRTFGTIGLKLKKHSPEILVVGGVVGTVTSAVIACKATTKLDSILEEHKVRTDAVHNIMEHPENLPEGEEYTLEDSKKDLTIIYTQTGLEIVKLYAPAVALGSLSIAAILAGHNITRQRYIATAAAYTAVDKAFKDYRGRVVERFGEALDKELRYNIKSKEVEEVVQNEDGTTTVEKKVVDVIDDPLGSPYAFFFDESNPNWTKDPEWNKMFLIDQQRYANDLLKRKGHLFLNEVHDMLGADRTRAGQVVGWIYDEKNPNGDNYIDFGIFNINREANRRFVNGYEKSILIDPNVDGEILNKF